MTEKKFLQETNFSEDVEETKPENRNPEKSNETIRRHNERIWSDANLRDGSYWPISETKAPKRQERHSTLAVLLVRTANYETSEG